MSLLSHPHPRAARFRSSIFFFVLFVSFVVQCLFALGAWAELRAGAFAQDITPTEFPVIVNGGFNEVIATKANDVLHARAIVLADGKERIAIVVVDSCMLPRELIDEAKGLANKATGIAVDRMLISATHSHTAPSSMGCLGSDADANYVKVLPGLLAKAIEKANGRLAPAKVGFAVVNDSEHTACRRWVFRPDRMRVDPFGELSVRANMHPGYLSPDAVGPTGPIDPGLSVLAIQHADGRPLALLANYSMHYVGTTPLSADYYGRFCEKIAGLLKADEEFVGVMSQGTSGDMWLADYSKPKPEQKADIDSFAAALATEVAAALKDVRYSDQVDLGMRETTIKLGRRVPDEKRLAWAKEKVAALGGQKPKTQPDIYAREAIFLHDEPERELKLQAIRIGDVAIAAIPNEVYALTGLKIKGLSPLPRTFVMELANGSEGYIPPPEQHKLGGYTTWAARTAALEAHAEPKIAEVAVKLLEEVSGKKRRRMEEPAGPYAKEVLASKPVAYYRMAETAGPTATDASGNGHDGTYEDGVLFYLPGPDSPAFTGDANIPDRAPHFAGGRFLTSALTFDPGISPSYTIEFWFWNAMPVDVRPVTGILFCGSIKDANGPLDHLWIQGTADPHDAGRLALGQEHEFAHPGLVSKSVVPLRTWSHVAMTYSKEAVTQLYLNGQLEASGQTGVNWPRVRSDMSFGGGHPQLDRQGLSQLEGKLDEIALYDRALPAEEIARHFKTAGLAAAPPAPAGSRNAAPRPSAQPPVGELQPAGATTQLAIERPPRSPAESLKALHLPGDLAIELVASEPLIASPVAIDWGADGKLWVVEMADYPYGMDGKGKAGGRIKYLESSKGDGHYDKATLFLDGIKMPNGIIAWRKGVIVTAATEIFYAEDTDGDGKADKREVLFKGFKEGNPQLRENGLRWGIDNWLYVASGLTGGVVESTRTGQKLDLKGRDLRVRPDTGEMELVSGPSQFGREHDDAGRWFGTDNSHPLFHYVLEDRYLRRNAYLTPPDSKNQLLPLPLPPVFPKSPFARRYIGLDHHGHFTSACGISVYRDELLFGGEGLHAFICEPVHNLVQHQVLSEAGATFSAKRVDGEAGADFLASEDNWFRPVMTRCGPDGAIWVVDMYRFMIEHPDWLNETGKKELAPFYRDGAERGRIYRIYPKNGAPRTIVRMDQMGTAELAKMLESPSGYVRDRAQQMLLWRGEPGAVAELARLFGETKNARARLHALCAIEGLVGAEKVSRELIARGLGDSDAAVRVAALRIAEVSLADTAVLKEVTRLRADPSPFVRLQLACTLGASEDALAAQTLAEMAIGNPQDSLLASAIASSMGHHSEEVMQVLLARPDAMGLPIFRQIVQSAAASDDRAAMEQLVNYLVDPARRGSGAALAALANLMDALAAHGKTLRAAGGKGAEEYPGYATIVRLIEEARQIAPDAKRPMEERVAATELLGRLPDQADAELEIAGALITSQNPAELQLAAIRAAARTGADAVAKRLLAGWATHSPAIRAAVADALLPREAWALALAESPAARELDFSRRQRLLNHSSAKVKAAAKTTLAQAAVNADRQKVIDGYQAALTLSGDAAHGQALFGEHCATCHRMGSAAVGHDIGPNLLTVRDWPKENILTALLDPDRTVEPRYVAYTATLAADGSQLTGLLTSESAGNVILKTLDDVDHPLPRSALKSLVSTNRSLMPQGFEAALQPQDVADLMAYVQSPSGGK